MRIVIESTTKIVEIRADLGGPPIRCRVWEGFTSKGVPVSCIIPRISAPADVSQEDFQRQLEAAAEPTEISRGLLAEGW